MTLGGGRHNIMDMRRKSDRRVGCAQGLLSGPSTRENMYSKVTTFFPGLSMAADQCLCLPNTASISPTWREIKHGTRWAEPQPQRGSTTRHHDDQSGEGGLAPAAHHPKSSCRAVQSNNKKKDRYSYAAFRCPWSALAVTNPISRPHAYPRGAKSPAATLSWMDPGGQDNPPFSTSPGGRPYRSGISMLSVPAVGAFF